MRFDSILIVLTEACHVGCAHCGYIGSKRDREVESPELENWIEQMISYGIPEIIFTGGEAFERYETLAAGVKRARECGAKISVFTSSFWASSREEAKRVLQGLNGLTKVYLSTDLYHQKRVPFAYVRNAIDAAIELGIPKINLNITFATEADRDYVAAQYADYGDRVVYYMERVIPTPLISPRVLAAQDPLQSMNPTNYSHKCWLATPLIDPNGDLYACHIGKVGAHGGDIRKMPYFLGNLRETSFTDIMRSAQQRNDYQFLRTHGPKGVAEMAVENPKMVADLPRRDFTNACDMCVCTLTSPKGGAYLAEHARTREDEIDVRLALLLGEEPVFASRDHETKTAAAGSALATVASR
jgi:MoaA/NifB/PqqE/SkfB family radical SAM enzyme